MSNTDGGAILDAAMSEAEWQNTVVEAARMLGYYVYHTADSRRNEPGFPDLVMVHPEKHRLIFAELKTERGKVSTKRTVTKKGRECPSQHDWILALMYINAYTSDRIQTFVWRPSEWPDVERTLKA